MTTEPYAAAAPSPSQAKRIIEERAINVLESLANRDLEGLASDVHPQKGVRFSPYTYVDVTDHTVLTRDDLLQAGNGPTRHWGYLDGSGDEIELSFDEYSTDFIYPYDYREAPQRSYNQPLFTGI